MNERVDQGGVSPDNDGAPSHAGEDPTVQMGIPAHIGSEGGEEAGSVVRHEEEVSFEAVRQLSGTVRARKVVEVEVITESIPVDVEYLEMERVVAAPDDDGQTRVLADGSVSIAVLEERVVIRTETVVAERITLRKFTNREERTVEAEARKERVVIDDSEVPGRVTEGRSAEAGRTAE